MPIVTPPAPVTPPQGPGTPVAPQSPSARTLHPDAVPDDDDLFYGPDTSHGVIQIENDIAPEEKITERFVQDPENRELESVNH